MEKLHPHSLSTIYQEKLYKIDNEFITPNEVIQNEEQIIHPTSIKKDTSRTLIPTQGKGINNILIINFDTASEFISQNDSAFLTKIIAATKNNLEECSLVSAYNKQIVIQDIINQTNAQNIICFGVNPFEIGLKDKTPMKYELSDIGNNSSIIPVDSLKEISQNDEKKKAFWFALKRMFNV